MARSIYFDVTHLVHRYAYEAPSGIDRVDLAYGRFFGLNPQKLAGAIHYGQTQPQVLPAQRVGEAVLRLEEKWREKIVSDKDDILDLVQRWLRGKPVPPRQTKPVSKAEALHWKFKIGVIPFLRLRRRPPIIDEVAKIPQGAIYLNIAQHATEHAEFFTWIAKRPDLHCVFFLHDLLPLDYPEYWWRGHRELFERRVKVIATHATALITSSHVVADRARAELKLYGKADLPILTLPLPSPIETDGQMERSNTSSSTPPYFVIVGTIEPRKNHLLLLNIWRALAHQYEHPPKLIVVGTRGWENEQAVGMLERCESIKECVLEISGLSNAGLRQLIAGSRALLMPSWAEGYGLPIVEALSLGTPVIASDIPVFREISQGKAIFIDPLDGAGWRQMICDLMDSASPRSVEARQMAAAYDPPKTDDYFQAVERFLDDLPSRKSHFKLDNATNTK